MTKVFMKIKVKIRLVALIAGCLLAGCSSINEYESDVFPDGDWRPINPEYFGKDEAIRIVEGALPK